MSRTIMKAADSGSIADLLSLSVLGKYIPLKTVQESLLATGKEGKRERELPSVLIVYYVISMCLYMYANQREVLRLVMEYLRFLSNTGRKHHQGGETEAYKITGKSGISQAKKRIGSEPLAALYYDVVQPIGNNEKDKRGWYGKYRKVSMDGTVLDVADEQENREVFGVPGVSRGVAAFPQARLVGVVENGSHVLFGVAQGGYHDAEVTLARKVLPYLKADMLLMADRCFYGYELWNEARATGAQLLWRVKSSMLLPAEETLADGSYLSTVYPSPKARRHRLDGVVVRVIKYQLGDDNTTTYRLITTLLDPTQSPAGELAALYHERWEFETVLDEFKTHLRGRQIILRSKKPDLVKQEIYGLLLLHFALRSAMYEAAITNDIPPLDISFTHTMHVIQRKLPQSLTIFP